MFDVAAQIAENLACVRDGVAEACRRAGRSTESVTLVAVTKYAEVSAARALVECGCRDLGESRPQELWRKAESLVGLPVRWHLVGHLQRNKVARSLPYLSLLHSLDSVRLAEAVDEAARNHQRVVRVLLEVNISGDATKHGFQPVEVEAALVQMDGCVNLQVCGLMAMASREGDLGQAQREFAAVRELRDRLRKSSPPHATLDELSMGMSEDYQVAIREGATIVRVGSALFSGMDA